MTWTLKINFRATAAYGGFNTYEAAHGENCCLGEQYSDGAGYGWVGSAAEYKTDRVTTLDHRLCGRNISTGARHFKIKMPADAVGKTYYIWVALGDQGTYYTITCSFRDGEVDATPFKTVGPTYAAGFMDATGAVYPFTWKAAASLIYSTWAQGHICIAHTFTTTTLHLSLAAASPIAHITVSDSPLSETLHVDPTLGTDDDMHGDAVGADAFATLQYALRRINTAAVTGDVTTARPASICLVDGSTVESGATINIGHVHADTVTIRPETLPGDNLQNATIAAGYMRATAGANTSKLTIKNVLLQPATPVAGYAALMFDNTVVINDIVLEDSPIVNAGATMRCLYANTVTGSGLTLRRSPCTLTGAPVTQDAVQIAGAGTLNNILIEDSPIDAGAAIPLQILTASNAVTLRRSKLTGGGTNNITGVIVKLLIDDHSDLEMLSTAGVGLNVTSATCVMMRRSTVRGGNDQVKFVDCGMVVYCLNDHADATLGTSTAGIELVHIRGCAYAFVFLNKLVVDTGGTAASAAFLIQRTDGGTKNGYVAILENYIKTAAGRNVLAYAPDFGANLTGLFICDRNAVDLHGTDIGSNINGAEAESGYSATPDTLASLQALWDAAAAAEALDWLADNEANSYAAENLKPLSPIVQLMVGAAMNGGMAG